MWHEYQPVRDKYPTLDSRPTSAALAALLDLPVLRPLSYQENRTSCKGDFNLPSSTSSRNRNLKAALLQASAAPSEQACSRCAERKNLWDSCVGGEGCAGCTYNGNGKQCSNRTSTISRERDHRLTTKQGPSTERRPQSYRLTRESPPRGGGPLHSSVQRMQSGWGRSRP